MFGDAKVYTKEYQNGLKLSDLGAILTRDTYIEYIPPVEIGQAEVLGREGAIPCSRTTKTRKISLAVHFSTEDLPDSSPHKLLSLDELDEQLTRILTNYGQEIEIEFLDFPGRFYKCYLDSAVAPKFYIDDADVGYTLICYDLGIYQVPFNYITRPGARIVFNFGESEVKVWPRITFPRLSTSSTLEIRFGPEGVLQPYSLTPPIEHPSNYVLTEGDINLARECVAYEDLVAARSSLPYFTPADEVRSLFGNVQLKGRYRILWNYSKRADYQEALKSWGCTQEQIDALNATYSTAMFQTLQVRSGKDGTGISRTVLVSPYMSRRALPYQNFHAFESNGKVAIQLGNDQVIYSDLKWVSMTLADYGPQNDKIYAYQSTPIWVAADKYYEPVVTKSFSGKVVIDGDVTDYDYVEGIHVTKWTNRNSNGRVQVFVGTPIDAYQWTEDEVFFSRDLMQRYLAELISKVCKDFDPGEEWTARDLYYADQEGLSIGGYSLQNLIAFIDTGDTTRAAYETGLAEYYYLIEDAKERVDAAKQDADNMDVVLKCNTEEKKLIIQDWESGLSSGPMVEVPYLDIVWDSKAGTVTDQFGRDLAFYPFIGSFTGPSVGDKRDWVLEILSGDFQPGVFEARGQYLF